MAPGQGYNATIDSGMNNAHEAASTQIAVTHETSAPVMPEHPMPTVDTTAAVMPEHTMMPEHPMPTVETVHPVMPEHTVMLEHPMPVIETVHPVMPEHTVMPEHPMPVIETAHPMMPEHSVMVEHPMLTIVETAMGHDIGLASTFTRIIVEAHGNTMPAGVETAIQVNLIAPSLDLSKLLTRSSLVSPPSSPKGPPLLAGQSPPNPLLPSLRNLRDFRVTKQPLPLVLLEPTHA
jgi:hypothetical protein